MHKIQPPSAPSSKPLPTQALRAAAESADSATCTQLFHESLETQEYHLGRIERRIVFLKERIAGTTTSHQISKKNHEQRKQFEQFELNALVWAAKELRKVIDSNARLMKHFEKRFAEKVPG